MLGRKRDAETAEFVLEMVHGCVRPLLVFGLVSQGHETIYTCYHLVDWVGLVSVLVL